MEKVKKTSGVKMICPACYEKMFYSAVLEEWRCINCGYIKGRFELVVGGKKYDRGSKRN